MSVPGKLAASRHTGTEIVVVCLRQIEIATQRLANTPGRTHVGKPPVLRMRSSENSKVWPSVE